MTTSKLLVAFLFGLLPQIVTGTSRLVLKDGSAQCTGDWDLNVLRVHCGENYCSYGDIAYLSGQSKKSEREIYIIRSFRLL